MNDNLYLREAIESDCDTIFEWANDEETRQNSFSTEKIEYADHLKWYEKVLKSDDIKQFIMVLDNGEIHTDVGQIRLRIKDDMAEISYSIAPEFRGAGYGKKIIELIKKETSFRYPFIRRLCAEIKPENTSSARCFLKNDFYLKYQMYEMKM